MLKRNIEINFINIVLLWKFNWPEGRQSQSQNYHGYGIVEQVRSAAQPHPFSLSRDPGTPFRRSF